MSRSAERSRRRPFVRPSRRVGMGSPGALLASAGEVGSRLHQNQSTTGNATYGRAAVELLEDRKLLFALTIAADDVDPGTGLGIAQVEFEYIIHPLLMQGIFEDVDVQDPVTSEEAFDPDNVRIRASGQEVTWISDTGFNSQIFSGDVFSDSTLRVDFTGSAPGETVGLRQLDEFGFLDADEFALQANLNVNNRVSFRYEALNDAQRLNLFRDMAAFQFQTLSGAGLIGLLGPTTTIGQLPAEASQGHLRNDTNIQLVDRAGNALATFNVGAIRTAGGFVVDPSGRYAIITNQLGAVDNWQIVGLDRGIPGVTWTFSEVRFVNNAVPGIDPADGVLFDNLVATFPAGQYDSFVDARRIAVQATLVGPVGARAEFFDLYGRSMRPLLFIGAPEGADRLIVDQNADGVPDFNDGIGRIIISNADLNTTLTLLGGTVEDTDMGFQFVLVDNVSGILDQFEAAGFGYAISNDPMNPAVIGLPDAGGSVIVGSPFVRANPDVDPGVSLRDYFIPPGSGGQFVNENAALLPVGGQISGDAFTRSDQGVIAIDGSNVGGVYIHGILHGQSVFSGAVSRINVGVLIGSISVDGDMGELIVATDAGLFVRDDDTAANATLWATRSQLLVGRTLREVAVGGRSNLSIQVLGDVNNATRARLPLFDQFEREFIYGIDTAADENATLNALAVNRQLAAKGAFFGAAYFRNDTIMSAEFIGGNTTAVRINGTLDGADPVNSDEDPSDVYAFNADPTREVVIQDTSFGGAAGGLYMRVVDADGRVIAATRAPDFHTGLEVSSTLRFRPDRADTYYLVVGAPTDGGVGPAAYTINVFGLAPTVFGQYRSAGSTGGAVEPGGVAVRPSIMLSSGDMGSLRIGTGLIGSDGGEVDPAGPLNGNVTEDNQYLLRSSSISIAGNLYSAIFGGDIGDIGGGQIPTITVGRNLGSLVTGLAPELGLGPTQGDMTDLVLNVGGSIGLIDIKGGLGIDQDPDTDRRNGQVTIRTGQSGQLPGHIGSFFVGSYVSGTAVNIILPANSRWDTFIVGASNTSAGVEGDYFGVLRDRAPNITMGTGSDIRFVDFVRREAFANRDVFTPLIGGTPVSLTDDAGATITINTDGLTGVGRILTLPINGSQGVAIARIEAPGLTGFGLQITGNVPGVVSIGRIITSTADDNLTAGISFTGTTEIDILRIEHVAGAQLLTITNSTPGGDIVAADVIGVLRVEVAGDLGRTQVNGVGPSLLGPRLGISAGFNQEIGAPIGVDQGGYGGRDGGNRWNGDIFVPINTRAYASPGFLEDLGSPVDDTLNGLIVRAGDVQAVIARGAIGDVILQGGDLLSVTANRDNIIDNQFRGLIGSLYATTIGTIDVGDGLAPSGPSPFAAAGIFAVDDIYRVIALRVQGARITGVITAGNSDPTPRDTIGNGDGETGLLEALAFPITGIGQLDVRAGQIDSLYIASTSIDSYWTTFRTGVVDNYEVTGNIELIQGRQGTNFFRSHAQAFSVVRVDFTQGAYDASVIQALGEVTIVTADEFRNSTRLGDGTDLRANLIRTTGNVGTIQTTGRTGDISDLVIDVDGRITGTVAAQNIDRTSIAAAVAIARIDATNDIRGSSINSGRIENVEVARNIATSEIVVAGPIVRVNAGGSITQTEIRSAGVDGRIDTIRAFGFITGVIESSGPIGTIETTAFDIIARIITTDTDGSLNLLRAARDLVVETEILGNVNQIVAGRHIGRFDDVPGRRVINITGNLTTIEAPTGQIYTDVQVTGTIGTISMLGRVANLVGNDQVSRAGFNAFGRINTVNIAGDFAGSIVSESGGIGTVRITNGTLRIGSEIRADNGSIDLVSIVGGHLMGNIHAEQNLTRVEVLGAPGFWGSVGVNPFLNPNLVADAFRTAMPPDARPNATLQGARITAGRNIGTFIVDRGSFFESGLFAGSAIGTVSIAGVVRNDDITPGANGNFIIAGDSIDVVNIGAFAGGLVVAAGITDLGADNLPGGTGANADSVKSGRINQVNFGRGVAAVSVSAGFDAGADGRYGFNPQTGRTDDRVVAGNSSIGSVTAASVNPSFPLTVSADAGIGFTSPGIIRNFQGPASDPTKLVAFVPTTGELTPNVSQQFMTATGERFNLTFSGEGRVFWNATTNTVTLINTTLSTNVTVSGLDGTLTNFNVRSNNGGSLGNLSVAANLVGNSNVYIDSFIGTANFGNVNSTGIFGSGDTIQNITFGNFARGRIESAFINNLTVGGSLGNQADRSLATIDVLSIGNLIVGGTMSGVVSADRDINAVLVQGAIDQGVIRAGRSINSVIAQSGRGARISSGLIIGTVNIAGDFNQSFVYAGADIGPTGEFGPDGRAFRVTNGTITEVRVGGNFIRSDVAAGVSRGPDNFIGTSSDEIDEGRSSIGRVIIGGTQIGSLLNSESFGVISNGTINEVRVNGQLITGQVGNFRVEALRTRALPLTVTDLRSVESGQLWSAILTFNQPVNEATLRQALRVSEVRANDVRVFLAENADYTVTYNPQNFTARIDFAIEVTTRSLPQLPGLAGPGVYNIELDAAIIRGQTIDTRLDGNNDGAARGDDDNYTGAVIIGDVGDKIAPSTVAGTDALGRPIQIDFYGAASLDVLLGSNVRPNGLPEPNRPISIRGTLGDHPDHNLVAFRPAGDVDVYEITLLAGQILRLGAMGGVAIDATRSLLDADGNVLLTTSGAANGTADNAFIRTLPTSPITLVNPTAADHILIKQTGTYYIRVSSTVDATLDVTSPSAVFNPGTAAANTGSYNFDVTVFDDGDTGFVADNNAGDGTTIVHPPLPSDVRFDNGGTANIQGFTFRLDFGNDMLRGTHDDIVTGTRGGITVRRTAGADGVFGTQNDLVETFINSSIGTPNRIGVPGDVEPDVDVWILNSGQPIIPGQRIIATLRLTELGSNIGLTPIVSPEDLGRGVQLPNNLAGTVQFGLFQLTGATNISDGILVAAPTDVLPIGGTPGLISASQGVRYGFDQFGDFFMDFIVPGRVDTGGEAPAAFALVVQGSVRSDYSLHIQFAGTGTRTNISQNVFIETNGGILEWFATGEGLTTEVGRFEASTLGFQGLINGQPVGTFIINNLVTNLNNLFAAANVDVRFSADPAAFQGRDFSTVFITSDVAPNSLLDLGDFGASQRSDPFNADPNDEAVVFVPSLAALGFGVSNADVTAFTNSLTAAVARRVGELVGLRLIADNATTDPQQVNSPALIGGGFQFGNFSSPLSSNVDFLQDTAFFIGNSNNASLLRRILAERF